MKSNSDFHSRIQAILKSPEPTTIDPVDKIKPYEKEIGTMSFYERIIYKISMQEFLRRAILAVEASSAAEPGASDASIFRSFKENLDKPSHRKDFEESSATLLAFLVWRRLGSLIPPEHYLAFRNGFKVVVFTLAEQQEYDSKHEIDEKNFLFPFCLPGPQTEVREGDFAY